MNKGMMERRVFWGILSILILFFIVSLALRFGIASAGYLLAAVSLTCAYNDNIFHGGVRAYYKSKEKLEKYRKLCFIEFVIFSIVGTIGLIIEGIIS